MDFWLSANAYTKISPLPSLGNYQVFGHLFFTTRAAVSDTLYKQYVVIFVPHVCMCLADDFYCLLFVKLCGNFVV